MHTQTRLEKEDSMARHTGPTHQISPLWSRTWPTSRFIAAVSLIAGMLTTVPAAHAAMPGCTVTALSAIGVPAVTVASATDVAATGPTPEYCRVLGSVASPSGNPNGDGFSLDLPASWSGRFLMSGGGGFAGSVSGPNPAAIA